jgi:hypothetical protein
MDPRYPIGKFQMPAEITPARRQLAMDQIAQAPANFRAAVKGLEPEQLDTPYRDGGWTVRQVIHHVPDSHTNAYIRLRMTLTEDKPSVTAYKEAAWAELPDAKSGPIEPSLLMLESLHNRWVRLWRSLQPEQFARTLVHPEHGERNLDWLLFIYEWHGKHHATHITELRKNKGW